MKRFYVTLKRDKRTAWLLGPFVERERATAAVKEAFDCALALDQWVWFDSYGTSAIESNGPFPPGVLNKRLPHLLEAVDA